MAKVYDRPGKDAAIDIKSGDGTCVYQAKYIGDQKFDSAIRESEKELVKIKKYKQKTHSNYPHWVGVKKWCLITNARWNPADELNWEEEVVKKFKAEGFEEVMLWHHAVLVEKIIKYPHIKQEYFEGENRVIICLSEAFSKLENDQIVSFAMNRDYLGRHPELGAVDKFLESSNTQVLPIHGPGGVGKTRFALEVSSRANEFGNWDVYWTNVETMSSSSSWFQVIIPSRKTLLVIDEPENANTIKVLLEQISQAKMSNWKVLVVTRSPKDPVLQTLRNPRNKILAEEIELTPLDDKNIGMFSYDLLTKCENLKTLREDDLRRWAKEIGRISNGFPIWATMAVFLVEKGKPVNDLPKDEKGLANEYNGEILKFIPVELNGDQLAFKEFLQLISLFQPINTETDEDLLHFIAKRINLRREEHIHTLFSNLIDRKVCKKRGRLVEIKPDVIRDHVLYDWLGKNKLNAEALVKEILGEEEKFPQPQKVLQQLGRLELSFKLTKKKFSVLDPIVSELKKTAENGTLLDQYYVLELASEFCFSRPMALVEISKIVRKCIKPNEKLKDKFLGEVELSHFDLVLKLPWELYNIGRYCVNEEEQEKVFMELVELAKYEYQNISSEKEYLKNDGKRALVLLERLLPGGKEQFRSFDKIANSWLEKKFEEFNNIGDAEWHIFAKIAKILLSIEREDFYSEGMKINIKRYLILPTSEAGKMRQNLRLKLWEIVEGKETDTNKRRRAWKLLEESHQQADIASEPRSEKKIPLDISKYWEEELKNNLERVRNILQKKQTSLLELNKLKKMWEWHYRVDKRDVLKKLAEECEQMMTANYEVSNFIQLFSYGSGNFQKKKEFSREIAKNLDSTENIYKFISDAYDFSGESKGVFWDGVREVAFILGHEFFTKEYVRQYIAEVFKSEVICETHILTAAEILAGEIKRLREEEPNNLFEHFFEYYSFLRNDEAKQAFLDSLYPRPAPDVRSLLIDKDMDILSRIIHTQCYPDMAISNLFFVLGYMFYINFDEDKRIIATLWSRIKSNEAADYYSSLVRGVWYRIIFSDKKEFALEFPGGFFKWLIGQLNLVPDLDDIRDLFRNEFLDIRKKTGEELDVCWFYSFLHERVDKIEKGILKDGKFISNHNEIFNCVKNIKNPDEVTEVILDSFRKLLQFNNHKSALRYYLPEILNRLDPHGIVLPGLIVEKIRHREFQREDENAKKTGYEWVRYAGYYSIKSESWRIIAIEACKLANELDDEQIEGVYAALLGHRASVWSGTPGEVPSIFVDAVDRAKKDLENEEEDILKRFMAFRLKAAENVLSTEKQRIEEEGM